MPNTARSVSIITDRPHEHAFWGQFALICTYTVRVSTSGDASPSTKWVFAPKYWQFFISYLLREEKSSISYCVECSKAVSQRKREYISHFFALLWVKNGKNKFRPKKISIIKKSKKYFSSKINWTLLLDDTEALFTQIWPFATHILSFFAYLHFASYFMLPTETKNFKSKFWKIRSKNFFFLENIVRYTFEGAENDVCV